MVSLKIKTTYVSITMLYKYLKWYLIVQIQSITCLSHQGPVFFWATDNIPPKQSTLQPVQNASNGAMAWSSSNFHRNGSNFGIKPKFLPPTLIPGQNRVLVIAKTSPPIYLGIDKSNILRAYSAATINPISNTGCHCDFIRSLDEDNGFYFIINGMKICSAGEGMSCGVCHENSLDWRKRTWYVTFYGNSCCLKRGGLCLTVIRSVKSFEANEFYECEMRKCDLGNPDQLFDVDCVENFE